MNAKEYLVKLRKEQRLIVPYTKVHNQAHSLKLTKRWPVRFARSRHTEPLHEQAQLIKIIRPYRIYIIRQGGVTIQEVRCNICGAICVTIWGHPTTDDHYYLACPVHGLKSKTANIFIEMYPKFEKFYRNLLVNEDHKTENTKKS